MSNEYNSDQADDSDDDRLVIDQLAEDQNTSGSSTKYRFPSGPYIETDSEATPTKPKHIPVDTSDDESMPELEDASEEMPALGKKRSLKSSFKFFQNRSLSSMRSRNQTCRCASASLSQPDLGASRRSNANAAVFAVPNPPLKRMLKAWAHDFNRRQLYA